MATNTYDELQIVTVANATATVQFTSIPQNYTDLVIVANIKGTSASNYLNLRFNSDTGSNYSRTTMSGNGSSIVSERRSNQTQINTDYNEVIEANLNYLNTLHIMNYSNITTNKTVLCRANNAATGVGTTIGLWRNNAAITSIELVANNNNFDIGSNFSLYGIRAEGVNPAPKATGGAISSDSTYYYHAFGATGTFTPLQNLTNVDYLVIAGGGGGKTKIAGGGGAGGYRTTVGASGGGASSESKISLNNGVAYTVTIGGGGNASNGTDSSISGSGISTITSVGGGTGGLGGQVSGSTMTGSSGGSGGGGGANEQNGTWPAGSGTAGQGFAGASGLSGSSSPQSSHAGGGGGGAGEAAPTITAMLNRGGNGLQSSIDGVWRGGGGGGGGVYTQPTSTTFGAEGRGGGGRGGGYFIPPTNGVANTGGGGGGGGYAGAGEASSSGGSGIIIIRYAK